MKIEWEQVADNDTHWWTGRIGGQAVLTIAAEARPALVVFNTHRAFLADELMEVIWKLDELNQS